MTLHEKIRNDGEVSRSSFADKATDTVPALPSPNDREAGLAPTADEACARVPAFLSPNRSAGRISLADKVTDNVPAAATPMESGQTNIADEADFAVPDPDGAEGQSPHADKADASVLSHHHPIATAGQRRLADKAIGLVPAVATIDLLAELQVYRKFWIGSVNRQTNAARALVRRFLGWTYDDPDREKINANAARMVKAALAGKDTDLPDSLVTNLMIVNNTIEPLVDARKAAELRMKQTVRTLPVYEWTKGVGGLGELGLAVIIGEAGDLAAYPKKGHLWKRLGLAPYQGKAMSTWRREGGLKSEDWTAAGYSPRRRAEIYACVSEPMIKHQIEGAEKSGTTFGLPKGPYGEVYVRRREHLVTAHPDWTPKHCQMDALRVMTKHVVRDLWKAWRA